MTFQPGQSGNPGGRPKALVEVQEAAREHTSQAIAVLAQVANDVSAPPSARVAACNALLDRAWGKPLAQVEAKVAGVTSEELIRDSIKDRKIPTQRPAA